jgi:serralysin
VNYLLDFRGLDVTTLLTGTPITTTSTIFVTTYPGGILDAFLGVGLTYDSASRLTGGTLTGYQSYLSNGFAGQVSGLSGSINQLLAYARVGDTSGALAYLLSSADQVAGGTGNDYLMGFAGNDNLQGLAGDDTVIGGSGNDMIDSGAGIDIAIFTGAANSYTLNFAGGAWTVADQRSGAPDGADILSSVELLGFSDRTIDLRLTDPATDAAAVRVLRTAGSVPQSVLVANGLATEQTSIPLIVKAAGATSSVATLAYEFFTGKAPTSAGMDYLVSPTGPNPNNLNSAYYQSFSLENRYINFAVNLGKAGEGNAAFTAKYGGLSLFEATRTAYATIFGEAPSDSKLHAILDPTTVLNGVTYSRSDYFAYYGQDGVNGVGTKAAMVGYLLAEAVKADLGSYALSNDAFLTDVAIHNAPFGVDLVGVYNQPGFVFHPG